MGRHDQEFDGSRADALPDDLVEAFEQERRYRDEVNRRLDFDFNAFQQEVSWRIQSETLGRLARDRFIIRLLSAVSTLEAIVVAALLVGSTPKVEESSVPAAATDTEGPPRDTEPPDAFEPSSPADVEIPDVTGYDHELNREFEGNDEPPLVPAGEPSPPADGGALVE